MRKGRGLGELRRGLCDMLITFAANRRLSRRVCEYLCVWPTSGRKGIRQGCDMIRTAYGTGRIIGCSDRGQ